MSDNLVDSMLQEMQANNSPADMNYAPNMSQGPGPVMQGHSAPSMGNVGYSMPPNDGGMYDSQMEGQMMDDEMDHGHGHSRGDVPDMDTYGMGHDGGEASSGGSMMSMPLDLVQGFKDPVIVIILAIILSLPQVNSMIRSTLSQFVGNPLYVNIMMAVLLGLVFYLLKLVL
jgi:hypothetical protein